jgi:DNA polymerase (family 10)
MRPFRVFHGAEVSIRRNGTLEYTDAVLSQFDFVVASVHGAFDQPRDEMTARVLKAIRHPYVDVLGHPLGRKLGEREEIALDLDAVIREARLCNVAMEIDSQPERLDLPDTWARRAREAGVLLAIDSDAHATDQLRLVRYGIATARRGWAERQHVLNALPLEALQAWRKAHRAAAAA